MGAGGGGLTPHSPRYVAKAIVRTILTGEAEVVIPHGRERPEEMEVAGSQA
jgi:hypothetical protein